MLLGKNKKQIIHLYTTCYNEEYMLNYFFRHYDTIVDRYVIFDDGSTDSTLDILKKHPKVEVRKLPRLKVDSFILSENEISNNSWKESRGIADWVILVDIDEFCFTPELNNYLYECTQSGITMLPALGYQMISQTLPLEKKSLLELVKRGCPWVNMNKLCIFNPNKIIETNNALGRHSSNPVGEVIYPKKDILLNLHYKYLSFENTFNRHKELEKKLGSLDKKNKWGHKYLWDKKQFKEDWDYFENNSTKNVFSIWHTLTVKHSALTDRWWRKK